MTAAQRLVVELVVAGALVTCLGSGPKCGDAPSHGDRTVQGRTQAEWGRASHQKGVALHRELDVAGLHRSFELYTPSSYFAGDSNSHAASPIPLWILAPGTYNSPQVQMQMSDMVAASEQYKFAFVALKAVDDQMLNVVLRGQADPKKPDDIAYTRAVVDEVQSAICVDERRIFCAGYSAGARFCSMVASELSSRIAAIAAVSGIRFPEPLEAHQRPMPIIAFHGKSDPVNPYDGHGNPLYWDDSVPRAIMKWTGFNKCSQDRATYPAKHITFNEHFACAKNASVVLVTIDDGGHTWPGSSYDFSKVVGLPLGKTTHQINANAMIAAFFAQHPLPTVNPAEAEAATLLQKAQLESHGPVTSTITSSQLAGGILAVVAALSGISAGAIAVARLARRPSCHHSESATMLSSDFTRSIDVVGEPCAPFLLDAVE